MKRIEAWPLAAAWTIAAALLALGFDRGSAEAWWAVAAAFALVCALDLAAALCGRGEP